MDEARRPRETFWHDLDAGLHRIFTGFLYKFVFAYLISLYWMTTGAGLPQRWDTPCPTCTRTVFICSSTSPGTARSQSGFAYLFGYRIPENFNLPFVSRNIKEFWTRWHISLSFWFRDFIYMRFLLARDKEKSGFAASTHPALHRQLSDVRRDGVLARHGNALPRLRRVPRVLDHRDTICSCVGTGRSPTPPPGCGVIHFPGSSPARRAPSRRSASGF